MSLNCYLLIFFLLALWIQFRINEFPGQKQNKHRDVETSWFFPKVSIYMRSILVDQLGNGKSSLQTSNLNRFFWFSVQMPCARSHRRSWDFWNATSHGMCWDTTVCDYSRTILVQNEFEIVQPRTQRDVACQICWKTRFLLITWSKNTSLPLFCAHRKKCNLCIWLHMWNWKLLGTRWGS